MYQGEPAILCHELQNDNDTCVYEAAALQADTNHTCIIGDSGGAFLALYSTAIINNPVVAEDFNIIIAPKIKITALALISGLFYTTANDFYGAFYKRLLYSRSAIDFEIPQLQKTI